MAGSRSKGKWEASVVTESAMLELKDAGYLPANIAHRAPEVGLVVPTPR